MTTHKTRRAAIEAGAVRFNTGRPCRAGHSADRYASTGGCVECLRLHREDFAATVRESRKAVADRSTRLFTYRLHEGDHAAALAFCQALDLQRGRTPRTGQAVVTSPPPREATREEVAAHRERLLQDFGATQVEPERTTIDPAMLAQLKAAGLA